MTITTMMSAGMILTRNWETRLVLRMRVIGISRGPGKFDALILNDLSCSDVGVKLQEMHDLKVAQEMGDIYVE